MKRLSFILLSPFLFMGCGNHYDVVERVSSQFETVLDSIYSVNIQNMIYTGNYLVWNCSRETPFLHIIDPTIGKEIVSVGSIGNGHHDFIVSVEYDYENGDEVVLNGNPDDFRYPHCLFVRDYKVTLLKIIDLGCQIKSISSDCENNDVCCLVHNPEYQIIKTVIA